MDTLKKMHVKACACNLSDCMGLFVFLMNIFWAGSGTIIAGIIVGGDKVKNNVIVGILQWFTAFILVGWIWSVIVGYSIWKVSKMVPG